MYAPTIHIRAGRNESGDSMPHMHDDGSKDYDTTMKKVVGTDGHSCSLFVCTAMIPMKHDDLTRAV